MFEVINESLELNLCSKLTLTKVLRLAEELRQRGRPFNSKTYDHIQRAYTMSGEDNTSILHKEMRVQGIKPSIHFYHNALQLAAEIGDATTQAKILHLMEQSGHKPTSKTYYLMLICMRENLELERALDTFDLMKKQKIKPEVLSYLITINLAINLHQPEIASDLLEEAEKLPHFGSKNKVFYIHVLRCAAHHGIYETTKLNWKKVVLGSNFIPDEGICLHVLNLAGKHGDPKLAGDVIRLLGEGGYTYRECHFLPLIESFALTGDIVSTFQVLTAMRKVGVIPSKKTTLPIARQLGRDANAVRKARDALEQMSKTEGQEVDISAFNLIIHAFAFNREYNEAISLYSRAKQFGVKPNSETLDATLDACIHCKDASLGSMIYQEQLSRGVKVTATTLSKMVALMCTQEKGYEDAFKYLKIMKHSNIIPLRGCYFQLVKTLSAANDPRLEMALYDMKAYGYNISNHMKEFMKDDSEERLNAEESEEEPINTLS